MLELEIKAAMNLDRRLHLTLSIFNAENVLLRLKNTYLGDNIT